ncbi:hypothetical protein N7522_011394 [Penicillium canescens]|uniref:uncharacterized protein n=1 Tax=Penicillium canescens TaxID=5083 RepID=UPI0026E0BE4D|nr:uncharacterized protein N7446_006991 [Penicillium canescens]KAJ5991187.1 hypothetical protein N7522_011394 [Penicillium canescens]KAJ6049681.1 hypothetical protein N7444_006397 [Penicillium canescens]KAJ6062871.1 hypothetical protein N7446_006991 [Penicillium canescens]
MNHPTLNTQFSSLSNKRRFADTSVTDARVTQARITQIRASSLSSAWHIQESPMPEPRRPKPDHPAPPNPKSPKPESSKPRWIEGLGGGIRLWHVESGQLIPSGFVFKIKTTNPENMPLPSFELLRCKGLARRKKIATFTLMKTLLLLSQTYRIAE